MTEKDDILQQAAKRFKLAAEYDKQERELADFDIRFAINDEGCQWPTELRRDREEDGRPCLVNNKIPEKIDQVDGEFKQLQPSFKVRAVDSNADPKIASIYSGIMRHIEYNSFARNAYNHAHTSTLYCGRGAWRINVTENHKDPFVRDIKVGRIPNILTVYWDPYAKEATKEDANYFFITELVDKTEFQKEHKDLVESWPDDGMWDDWKVGESYRIAEYWWKEKIKKKFYQVEREVDGMMSIVTTDKPGPSDQIKGEKEADSFKVRWCKMTANHILEGPNDWSTQYIPIIVELGKEINVRGVSKTRGMTRYAIDPMRMYNYWSSTATEQISLAPKAPYIAEITNISDFKEMWQNAHKKNYAVLPFKLNPNAPGLRPVREPPPQMSSAYQHEFMRLEHDIMSAMGIYQASLGDQGNEQSGRAIMARQKQGNIGSYPYTDSFHIAYLYSCRQLIELIPHVYDTERIVRIIGEDGNHDTVPVNARPNIPEVNQVPESLKAEPKPGVSDYLNELGVGEYDVAVSIGPSFTTQREETVAILLDMVKTAPMVAQAVMDLIAANMDVPKHSEELVKRLRKMVPIGIRELEPGEEPPQQEPDPKLLLEMAKLQLEKELKETELTRKEFEAQTKAVTEMMKAEAAEFGSQIQGMTAAMEQIRGIVDQHYQVQTSGLQQQHDMEMGQRDMSLREQQAQQMAAQPQGQEA